MKNLYDVLKQKEAALAQVQYEIEALRIAVRLLVEEGDAEVSRSTAPRMLQNHVRERVL